MSTDKDAAMFRQKTLSSVENILEDLQHHARERRKQESLGQEAQVRLEVKSSFGQILALLVSISLCFIVLSTGFNLTFLEASGIFVLIAGASGFILYLIRRMI